MGIRSDLLAATRRSLCEAAMQLFVERGIAATKVEDILNGSGISVGSFYYLFKNKLDLATNLYVETQTQLHQSLFQELSLHQLRPQILFSQKNLLHRRINSKQIA